MTVLLQLSNGWKFLFDGIPTYEQMIAVVGDHYPKVNDAKQCWESGMAALLRNLHGVLPEAAWVPYRNCSVQLTVFHTIHKVKA